MMLIQFAEIDLTQPIEPIYVEARYQRLFLIVRWGYLPLGMLFLHCQGSGCSFSAEQLRHEIIQSIGWQVWEQAVAGTLDRLADQPQRQLPPISVVVCTRDRALSLERCLAALAKLDYPSYEVIVVDNCSQDGATYRAVERSGYRYVREDRPGLDWARNCGMQAARHDIIAYIDDDAIATPGWLRGMARGFEDSSIMGVTGMVLPAEIETSAQNDFERYGGMSKGFIPYVIQRQGLSGRDSFWASNWGVGANMAFRRSLFDAIGGFDIALDVGTPTNGAGDIEFFYRMVSMGHALRYEPAAMVRHVHRRDRASLRRQIYNNGRSFPAYLLTIARNEPHRRWQVLWFALRWWDWHWLLRRVLVSIPRRDGWTLRMALTELWGAFSSLSAYRQAQQIAARQRAV
jgi:glycosyltransferase involved in cell wall biosynthesis